MRVIVAVLMMCVGAAQAVTYELKAYRNGTNLQTMDTFDMNGCSVALQGLWPNGSYTVGATWVFPSGYGGTGSGTFGFTVTNGALSPSAASSYGMSQAHFSAPGSLPASREIKYGQIKNTAGTVVGHAQGELVVNWGEVTWSGQAKDHYSLALALKLVFGSASRKGNWGYRFASDCSQEQVLSLKVAGQTVMAQTLVSTGGQVQEITNAYEMNIGDGGQVYQWYVNGVLKASGTVPPSIESSLDWNAPYQDIFADCGPSPTPTPWPTPGYTWATPYPGNAGSAPTPVAVNTPTNVPSEVRESSTPYQDGYFGGAPAMGGLQGAQEDVSIWETAVTAATAVNRLWGSFYQLSTKLEPMVAPTIGTVTSIPLQIGAFGTVSLDSNMFGSDLRLWIRQLLSWVLVLFFLLWALREITDTVKG